MMDLNTVLERATFEEIEDGDEAGSAGGCNLHQLKSSG